MTQRGVTLVELLIVVMLFATALVAVVAASPLPMQAVTAVVLVGVLLIALNATGLQLNAWSNQLESVSYALIALVGLYLLASQLLQLWRRFRTGPAGEAAPSHAAQAHARSGNPGHGHDHHHHHHHDHAHGEDCGHVVDARKLAGPFSWRKVAAVVFSVGIRPCTGAILVNGEDVTNRPVLELHGWGELQDAAHRLTREGRWDELGNLIHDDMLHAFALVAEDMDELPALMAARLGGLVDTWMCTVQAGDPERQRELVAAVRQAAERPQK